MVIMSTKKYIQSNVILCFESKVFNIVARNNEFKTTINTSKQAAGPKNVEIME